MQSISSGVRGGRSSRRLQKQWAVAITAFGLAVAAASLSGCGDAEQNGSTSRLARANSKSLLPSPPLSFPIQIPISSPITTSPKASAPLMTEQWPLNQTVLQYPNETRSLKSSVPDGQYTPKPIASTFMAVFGTNHIGFDVTMPWSTINSATNLTAFTNVTINHPEWGSDDGQTCAPMASGKTVSTHWPARGGQIEGAADPDGDHHMLVFDSHTARLYELFGVTVQNAGTVLASYSADAARCWDTTKPQHGSPGQNSADAAGLPILPLLLRYDEASSGSINHALRFTVSLTRANSNGGAFTLPASHAAGNNYSSMAYEGMRLKLRADFDASSFSPINKTIIAALKKYGIVLADNGRTGLVTGDLNSHWDTDDLTTLRTALTLNDFTPVNSGDIIDASGQKVE